MTARRALGCRVIPSASLHSPPLAIVVDTRARTFQVTLGHRKERCRDWAAFLAEHAKGVRRARRGAHVECDAARCEVLACRSRQSTVRLDARTCAGLVSKDTRACATLAQGSALGLCGVCARTYTRTRVHANTCTCTYARALTPSSQPAPVPTMSVSTGGQSNSSILRLSGVTSAGDVGAQLATVSPAHNSAPSTVCPLESANPPS